MNESRNDGGSVTNGLPSFDLENARRDLIAKRVAAGADTPIGHRCSNLIEQLDAYRTAEGYQKFNLEARIKHQMAELAELAARNKAQGE